MPLAAGQRLGPYEIVAALGAGGMGEVYRARDTRLGREVAVKILTDRLADSPAARQRFGQEARAVAALAHPNILALHDVGEEGPLVFVVTELLEGETLQDRLLRGPIPLRKLLEIATAIAEALAAAHAKAIAHRDLKPSNVFLTTDGRVKLLDFGLSKQRLPAAREGLEGLPTLSQTEPGTVLGTVGYMSPEQVRGEAADARSDIFSLGCVLYEMTSGHRAFARETAAETLAAIVRDEPPELLPPARAPLELRQIIGHCLEKKADERFQSARDLAFALRTLGGGTPPAEAGGRARPAFAALALAAALGAAGALVLAQLGGPKAALEPTHASASARAVAVQLTNYTGTEASGALSPDGRYFAFVSERGGSPDVWVRQVSGGEPLQLTFDETEEADLAYTRDGETLYFTRRDGGGTSIWAVGSIGGQPRKILSDGRRPAPSPDGTRLAYLKGSAPRPFLDPAAQDSVEVWRLDGSESRVLARGLGLSRPAWSPDGRTIAFCHGGLFEPRRVSLVDVPTGSARDLPATEKGGVQSLEWMPDGARLVVSYSPGEATTAIGSRDLGVLRIATGTIARLTMTLGDDLSEPRVSADGSRLLITTTRQRREVWKVPLGSAPDVNGRSARLLVDAARDPMWIHATRDGRTLLFNSGATGSRNLWTMPLAGGALPRQITAFPGNEVMHASLSPDGARVAFASSRTGNSEIWVQDVDGTNLRQVTSDVAADFWPIWSPDGRSLAFGSLRGGSLNIWKVAAAEPATPAELLVRDAFRGDWIQLPDGSGSRIVSTLAGDGGVRIFDVERRTVVRDIRFAGDSLALPVFSADARSFSISLREGRNREAIWIFDVATGQGRVAARFPERFRFFFRAAWTDADRALIVNRYDVTSHIALIDNF
jgi:Tol biopolymer transport system component